MLSAQITEKRLLAVPPQAFTVDGNANGVITIAESAFFRVGQDVIIESSNPAVSTLYLRIKRVINNTEIHLGDKDRGIGDRTDVSAFLVAEGATIKAIEQKRPPIPEQEIERLTYEEEPVIARRVILVDKYGSKYEMDNPLPVQLSDGSIEIGTVNAELEVQLSHRDNWPDTGDVHDSVRIGDGTDQLEINPDGSINVNVGGKKTPTIFSVSAPTANTQYQIDIPQATKKYRFRARKNSRIQYSFVTGTTNSNYITVKPGNIEVEENLILDSNLTIYFQTPKSGQEIEVLLWS